MQRMGSYTEWAVSSKFRNKGVAKFIFEQCEQLLLKNHIDSMRIDTHQDNLAMQGLLKKLKYNLLWGHFISMMVINAWPMKSV